MGEGLQSESKWTPVLSEGILLTFPQRSSRWEGYFHNPYVMANSVFSKLGSNGGVIMERQLCPAPWCFLLCVQPLILPAALWGSLLLDRMAQHEKLHNEAMLPSSWETVLTSRPCQPLQSLQCFSHPTLPEHILSSIKFFFAITFHFMQNCESSSFSCSSG